LRAQRSPRLPNAAEGRQEGASTVLAEEAFTEGVALDFTEAEEEVEVSARAAASEEEDSVPFL
jgi:hypothetical protein